MYKTQIHVITQIKQKSGIIKKFKTYKKDNKTLSEKYL